MHLVLTDLDLLLHRSIGGEMRVTRNEELAGLPIHESFIYRTPTVRFPAGFGVRGTYDAKWLNLITAGPIGPGRPLQDYLGALAAAISAGDPADLRVGCLPMLRVPLGAMAAQDRELGWREEPLPGLAPVPPAEFASRLARIVGRWTAPPALRSTDAGHGLEMRFDVTLHGPADDASGQPLLTITRLFVKLTELQWP